MRQVYGITAVLLFSGQAFSQNTGTPCSQVQSREFSDNFDVDQNGVSDPGQILWFDCFGGTTNHPLRDVVEPNNFNLQVDALANRNDAFFLPFIGDGVEMIFSVEADRNIYFEREQTGEFGLWTPNVARVDVDGLEVWGDSNSDHHSFEGDPGGVSLQYTGQLDISNVLTTDILTAIQGMGIGLNMSAGDIDLDAAMRWHGLGRDPDGLGGGLLAFSVAPVFDDLGNVILDGGEIFVMNTATLTANFLVHGGHVWDTNFSVMGTFGLENENINAIEAVPAPGVIALLALGGLTVSRRRRGLGGPSFCPK